MAIFSSRSVEAALMRISRFVRQEAMNNIAGNLKKGGKNALSTEWEVVLLDALDRFGEVEYEPETENGDRPDIWFSNSWVDVPNFVAEIKTVFQQNYDNVVYGDYFRDEFIRIVKKEGFNPNNFKYTVKSKLVRGRIEAAVPPKGELTQFLTDNMVWRLRDLQQSRLLHGGFPLLNRHPEVNIQVEYDGKQEYMTYQYPQVQTATSFDTHIVWRRLHKARDKIKRIPDDRMKGVILCDGGCSYLKDYPFGGKAWHDGLYDKFLQEKPDIAFVAVFSTDRLDVHRPWHDKRLPGNIERVSVRIFCLNEDLKDRLEGFFRTVVLECPEVIFNSPNAELRLRPGHFWGPRIDHMGNWAGGFRRDGGMDFRVSAKGLTQLLAGDITADELFRPNGSPIRTDDIEKTRLVAAKLASTPDDDDDVVAFKWALAPNIKPE